MEVPDVSGRETEVVLLGVVAGALWLAAAAFFDAARHPADPPVGARTLELGPEPPAVANLLVHEFRVTDEAVAATLIDLAARRFVEVEQRGVGVFYVRLRLTREEPLTSYERRVLEHLHERGLCEVHAPDGPALGPSARLRSCAGRRHGGQPAVLPMGAESDTQAWSSYGGGRWRPVRIRYPRLWPPGWGLDPRAALLGGLGA